MKFHASFIILTIRIQPWMSVFGTLHVMFWFALFLFLFIFSRATSKIVKTSASKTFRPGSSCLGQAYSTSSPFKLTFACFWSLCKSWSTCLVVSSSQLSFHHCDVVISSNTQKIFGVHLNFQRKKLQKFRDYWKVLLFPKIDSIQPCWSHDNLQSISSYVFARNS